MRLRTGCETAPCRTCRDLRMGKLLGLFWERCYHLTSSKHACPFPFCLDRVLGGVARFLCFCGISHPPYPIIERACGHLLPHHITLSPPQQNGDARADARHLLFLFFFFFQGPWHSLFMRGLGSTWTGMSTRQPVA